MALSVQDLIGDQSLAIALNTYSGQDGIVDYAISKKDVRVSLSYGSQVKTYPTKGHSRAEQHFIRDVFAQVDDLISLDFVEQTRKRRADINIFSAYKLSQPFGMEGQQRYQLTSLKAGCLDYQPPPPRQASAPTARPGESSLLSSLDLPGSRGALAGLVGFLVATTTGFLMLWKRDHRPKLTSSEKATIVHELGHSVGLQHPQNDPWNPAWTTRDTVMSYNRTGTSSDYTFSPLDIAAMQTLWGTEHSTPGLVG